MYLLYMCYRPILQQPRKVTEVDEQQYKSGYFKQNKIKIKAFGPYKFQQLKKFKWAYKYLKVKGVDIA